MKTLRWGLIGAGDIARKRIAPALRDLPECDFVAVSRSKSELADSFAKEFGAREWFKNWQQLVLDSEIDAVYIATPVFLHKEQTIAAAEAGKHILCEKPMALNVKECDEMIAACRANNVRLGIAYYRRFYPVIERIKQILADGEIGKPVVVQMNAFEYFNPNSLEERFWLVEKQKSGGGPMMDFGCHRLELLTYLFGSVSSLKSIVSNAVFDRQVEDTATVILQFASGLCANLTVSHAALEPEDTLNIFATKGSVHIPILNSDKIYLKTLNGERFESHPNHQNVHLPLIKDFTETILHHDEPQINGHTGKLIASLEEKIYLGETSGSN